MKRLLFYILARIFLVVVITRCFSYMYLLICVTPQAEAVLLGCLVEIPSLFGSLSCKDHQYSGDVMSKNHKSL